MAKLTELIKCNIDIITKDEFDKSVLKCSAENKIIHELMDDKFAIAEIRLNSLVNNIANLSTEIIRLEGIIRDFITDNNYKEQNHE